MTHIALLGDSIFDNAAYVGEGPCVIEQLRALLPEDWRATLAAIDGSMLEDVPSQLSVLVEAATHLIVSIGGNDALDQLPVLAEPARSMTQALSRLSELQESFELGYRTMLGEVIATGRAVAASTIYYPRFPNPTFRRQAMAALTLYNDVILRVAIERGVPVLDLRLICTTGQDYANAIEPSVEGGAKIAEAVLDLVQRHDFAVGEAVVFSGPRNAA